MQKLFSALCMLFMLLPLSAQQKEVLIMGTMHTVPKIVKNSYKPLLKQALQYQPEAIFVERPVPNDSISWAYLQDGWSRGYKTFFHLSDSLKAHFDFDSLRLTELLAKDFEKMTQDDLVRILHSFGYLRDYANYDFYRRLKAHGVKGPRKPTRNENGDLTAPLAIAMHIKRLQSMDDQQTNAEYHQAWKQCVKEGRENGNNDILRSLNKKDYRKSVLPAIFRRLGPHTNKSASLNRLHRMSSFTYVEMETEGCTLGDEYWRQRNHRMARHIGKQVMAGSAKRNIVIVGAAHVVGLTQEISLLYPEIKLRLPEDE